MKSAYLDWISAAPVLPEAAQAMAHAVEKIYGNASSRLHPWGVSAQRELNRARDGVARLIGAYDPIELVFTSSATEANNLAIKGIARMSERGKHIVIGAIDHPSIRMAAERLAWDGYTILYAPVDTNGFIQLDKLRELLSDETALVSVQHANTEIGTLQPVREIAELCRARNIPFHCDGCGVAGILPVNVAELGVSAYTIGSNAFWGPPGAGALWFDKSIELEPLLEGGAQERKMRAGTENIPAIIGMGVAAEIAQKELSNRCEDLARKRNKLESILREGFSHCDPTCFVSLGDRANRLPQLCSFRLEWVEGEALLLSLGADHIACVSGSACARPELGASYVLEALGVPEEQRSGGITMSVGWSTTEQEIEYAVERTIYHGKRLFAMSPMMKSID
ncbi:MAG: cysteine desulfurase [bacterium]|nr:cysteine desulfurase [bacterium]